MKHRSLWRPWALALCGLLTAVASSPAESLPHISLDVVAAAGNRVEPVVRDRDLYLSPVDLKAAMEEGGGDRSVVDVRELDAYLSGHIPGAQRIDLRRVKMERRLVSRRIVLVDDGWGSGVVERECRRLRERGFHSVHILEGGMNAWIQSGGERETAGTTGPRPDRVSASEFLSVRHYADWVVIYAGAGDARAGLFFSEAESMAAVAGTEAEDAMKRVLIVNRDGRGYEHIQSPMPAGWPVFYLEDGLDGMEKQLRMMASMKNRRTLRTGAGTAGCATCP